jgi:phage/plasmid-like protein (TIGR03299 family)
MAHDITIENGKAGMAFVGETPWHKLGSRLTPDSTFDEWTVESGLNFHVHRSPMYYGFESKKTEEREMRAHPSREILYRDDNGNPLGIVSKGYNVVQPAEVMHFFKDLAELGGFTMETAGSLQGGQKVWALAKIHDGAPIIGNDIVMPYVLMSTSFDASTATVAKLTAIRVVCQNTLTMAIGGKFSKAETAGNIVRVAHHSQWDAKAAKLELGIIDNEWDRFVTVSKRMAEARMPGHLADQILVDTLLSSNKTEEEVRTGKAYQAIMRLFDGDAIGSDMTEGRTVWQFVNSVTEYIDHTAGQLTDNRIRSAWFGAGNTMKMNVYQRASELVGAA